ncbi:metallophosphoesterase [Phormidium sp. CLA17]|uniref:metallophosphoesterase family protein n=1 Tax=Leptolyngbya sp. Cla-17 TaxID=2803751 RepID=UPI0014920440|nr:metallophosphoesterase [Leptolyngbya sp. Cla-17]MBM0740299.1 metallophosphoesterase [Leptolyngbya sp. Cla-17]
MRWRFVKRSLRESLFSLLFAAVLGLGLTVSLHACQAQTPQAPSNATTVSQSVAPAAISIPPETMAIAASAGAKGLFNPPRGDVRFVVISDLNDYYGATTYPQEVDKGVKLIPFWNPDMVLCSGDMVAGQDPTLTDTRLREMWAAFDKQVAAPIRQMKLPYGFTVGNHDSSSALGVSGKFLFERERNATAEYWNDPAHNPGVAFIDKFEFPFYYTYEFKDIFFLVWDGSSSNIPKEKLAWVEKALASEKAQSAKMRILLGHLPLYSVAVGRNQAGDVMDNAEQLRAMLEKYKVHTYISGHHHTYYPAHRGKMQFLHMGILGSGPRPFIDGTQPPRKAITIVDVKFDSPDLTTYTTYDIQTLQVIENKELPRYVAGMNGLLLRRDVEWSQLTAEERATCENRLGASLCKA